MLCFSFIAKLIFHSKVIFCILSKFIICFRRTRSLFLQFCKLGFVIFANFDRLFGLSTFDYLMASTFQLQITIYRTAEFRFFCV